MLAYFHGHCRICSFHFATRLNNTIELREHRIPVHGLGRQKPRELRFFLLQQIRGRNDTQAMVLECSLNLYLLIFRYSQSLHESGIRPPCSGYLRANNSLVVLNKVRFVVRRTAAC